MDDPANSRGRKAGSRYHHGDLRAALLDGALQMVQSEGAHAVSLRALARHVGVSTAAPYRHFDSRLQLLAALAERGFVALSREIRAAIAPHRDAPLARLREAGVAYVKFALANPGYYAVMFSDELVDRGPFPGLAQAAAESFSELTEAIRAGQEAGLLRPDDPAALTALAWSVVHGLSWLIGSGQGRFLGLDRGDADALGRYLGDRLIDGIAVR